MSIKFAKRVKALNPSPTLALDAHIKKMRASGIDVISFGVGEPDFDTPEHIKSAAKIAIDGGFTKYTPAAGTDSLKNAIAVGCNRDYGVEVKPSEIVISSGAKHSLFNIALALFDEGDEVIIPAPYWVSYPEQVSLAGAEPVFVETTLKDNFKITPAKLKKAITSRTKALLINSPSNPTGMIYTKGELKALIAVAREHDFYLYVDEIYDKLVFDLKFVSILNVIGDDPEMRKKTIVVNGVSKTYAMTGWRIGHIIADEKIAKMIGDIQSQTTSNPCSISQKAAEEAFLGSQKPVNKMVAEFKKRRDLMVKLLQDIKGVKIKSPDGSFYVFPDFSAFFGKKAGGKKIENTLQLCEYLLDEAKTGIVPGEAFGAKGYARLSFATSEDNIRRGLANIKKALEKLA